MFSRLFGEGAGRLRGRMIALYLALAAANLGAWAWALIAFPGYPYLLGTALLAYGFGLRHAVDADHIAAIDNVTRKLMQEGQRPLGVGLFFSLGHSTVVVALSAAIAGMTFALDGRFSALKEVGGIIGTAVSAVFLVAIALINLRILLVIRRNLRAVRNGSRLTDEDVDAMPTGNGLLGRLFRRLFRLIRSSWQMYPLGLLFGLGFDTATEVGLLGISATEASKGLPVWSIMVFPALFTAGMSLADTLDSTLMLGAYQWAFANPIRKLHYNLTITFVSALVALLVGGLEVLGLMVDKLALTGPVWHAIASINGNFGLMGLLIVGLFAASWAVSTALYRGRAHGW